MSAQKRRPQQPQLQQQQQYYPSNQYAPPQPYVQDPGYSHYTNASYQPQQQQQHHQQQQFYQPQSYQPTDAYALVNNVHPSASSSPYPQYTQYQAQSFPQHYGPPTGVAQHNVAQGAYLQTTGGYLTAVDYAAAGGDASPNHLTPGSMSSGHSPRQQSAGRSRLTNFVFPSQGASPSLESQVAHLHLNAAATSSLPNKPSSHQSTALGSSDLATGAAEPRSDISLRYPPLPSLPDRCATPPLLRSEESAVDSVESSKPPAVDRAVLDYISSLRSILAAYEKRDDLLRLRTEAVGFQPKQAWSAWQSGRETTTCDGDLTPSNPILGVRLLQRLDKLQRENDELGHLLSSKSCSTAEDSTIGEVEKLRAEVQDCHRLIEAMDKALASAEARATASERALQIACINNSTAMLPVKADAVAGQMRNGSVSGADPTATLGKSSEGDEKKSSATTSKNAGPARKPAKAAASSQSNANPSGKSSSQQHQRSNASNKARPPSAGKNSGNAGSKSTRSDKPSSSSSADRKPSKSSEPSSAKGK